MMKVIKGYKDYKNYENFENEVKEISKRKIILEKVEKSLYSDRKIGKVGKLYNK